MQTEKRNDESTIHLTAIESRLYKRIMPRKQDVVHALREQLDADAKALTKVLDEQNSLRAAHIRFMNLQEDARQKMARVKRLTALLADLPDTASKAKQFGIMVEDPIFDETPLWEKIVEVLRQTGELQVVDLHQVLNEIITSYEVTRQSLESALTTHSKEFQIKRRGREKYVSLKT